MHDVILSEYGKINERRICIISNFYYDVNNTPLFHYPARIIPMEVKHKA